MAIRKDNHPSSGLLGFSPGKSLKFSGKKLLAATASAFYRAEPAEMPLLAVIIRGGQVEADRVPVSRKGILRLKPLEVTQHFPKIEISRSGGNSDCSI